MLAEEIAQLPATRSESSLQLWAGIECTVNRVGDRYFDQLEWNGHARRIDDLERFAALGTRTLRYPILWERIAPDGLASADWRWADERLTRLRELGIRPVVGLVHHGSGPRDTSLVDPLFPEKLQAFARAVAERYPWVDAYTPVNEPLTTARFSGLYGHWYPHGQSDLTFAQALLNECRAVVLAMQAIREVNPAAQLIQTEDVGKIYSTPLLAYQADFENERRWATFDLLSGRLQPGTPMWDYLCWAGIDECALQFFCEHPCPPDILGINYYLTSQRFLDEHLEPYPPHTHGGNGRHTYADVEAVRVCVDAQLGVRTMLSEAWERYRRPIAITEAHLGCTREEQLRWLLDVWQGTRAARRAGVDVQAVTVWSLLGAFNWNSLVTRDEHYYEPGVFDVRGPEPRPTALAKLVRTLARHKNPRHPALAVPGWWRRQQRLIYPPVRLNLKSHRVWQPHVTTTIERRPLLITGATGTLGQAFARECVVRELPHRLLTRQEMDIGDPASIRAALADLQPWAVINAAGYVRVDDAEHDAERCFRENRDGPLRLAEQCAEQHVRLMTFSSDLVFDGANTQPYLESDSVAPLNVYGQSKAAAETAVLSVLSSALVIRTSAFFSPHDSHNFVSQVLGTLSRERTFVAASDVTVSPTYVPDLVAACLDLLIDGEHGIWHLANHAEITWAELARRVAQLGGFDMARIEPRPWQTLGWQAPRPRYSALGSERGMLMPDLEPALYSFMQYYEANQVAR